LLKKIAFVSLAIVGNLCVQAAENQYGMYNCIVVSPTIPGAASPNYRYDEVQNDDNQDGEVEKLQCTNFQAMIGNILDDSESQHKEARKTNVKLDNDLKSKRILADISVQTILEHIYTPYSVVSENNIHEMVNQLIMANDIFAQVYILQGVAIGLGLNSKDLFIGDEQ
jgi:hypothetical protein